MYRGTTPTHTFEADIDLSDADVMYITYSQGNKTRVEKSLDDEDGSVSITDNVVTVTLTQKDTLAFRENCEVRIQLRVGFADGSRIASNIIRTTADEILKEGEI